MQRIGVTVGAVSGDIQIVEAQVGDVFDRALVEHRFFAGIIRYEGKDSEGENDFLHGGSGNDYSWFFEAKVGNVRGKNRK